MLVNTFNQYTFEPISVVLAKSLVSKQFSGKYYEIDHNEELGFSSSDKKIPYQIIKSFKGTDGWHKIRAIIRLCFTP